MKTAIHNWQAGPLAPYACDPAKSRGRLHPEQEDPGRSPFQRDRDRIIHSAAFRRLEYKTQVFVNHEGDHYRTRLTHSLEVSQLARSISRVLGLNEDIAEALALAHDLGHTAFGHAGEDALKECMQPFGGFDHNAQTLRILTKLEQRYAAFDGLNLTWETLEGVAKHNGPVSGVGNWGLGIGEPPTPNPQPLKLPRAMAEVQAQWDLELTSYASAEAQVASLADDIAYNNHDIDDGLRSRLFSLEDIRAIPFVNKAVQEVERHYPDLAPARMAHEAVRRMVNRMVNDLVATTRENLRVSGVRSVEDIRALGRPAAAFSSEMALNIRELKGFLMNHMYRHWRVNRMTSKARKVLGELFTFFLNEPNCLPAEWQARAAADGEQGIAVVVCDYLAGMTDRFAIEEYERIFNPRERP
jgi:dGTPase